MNKLKYRNFFENVTISPEVKELIIHLINEKQLPKFKRFTDYFSFITTISELNFPISVTYSSTENRFYLEDSSTDSQIKTISFYNGCITVYFPESDYNVEEIYNLETQKLVCRHMNAENFHCYVYPYDEHTDFFFEVIPTKEDLNKANCNLEYQINLSLADVVFKASHKKDLLPVLCNEFFTITVDDLSFINVIERYSQNFTVKANRDGDSLTLERYYNYSLQTSFSFGKNSSFCFKTTQEDFKSLQKTYNTFLKIFGI